MADCLFTTSGGGGVSSDELTARAEHVLAGKEYVGADTDDEAGAGTMPDNGGMQKTLRAGESVTVPRGYHDGSGTVTAASLAEQTVGDAAPGDIIAGREAWVRGTRITGTMVEREGEQPTTGVTISDGLAHVGMLPGAYRKNGRYGTPEVKAPVDMVARAAGLDGTRMLQGYAPLGVPGQIKVFNTMGASGTDPRGSITSEYGIDLNAHTLWMHAPAHNAYYMREDGHPHICMDSGALGNATAQQVLQGCTFTSEHGLKMQGAMYRWPVSGDIGGQRVMDAYENTAFIGDYGSKGRGVFMRMPDGSQIDPTCMWSFAPMPGAVGRNIRKGVSIGGVPGEMEDYAASCIPFDGARFDGLHLSGWATGTLGGVPLQARDTVTQPMPWQNVRADSFAWGWALTPSVALTPFREVRVTIRTDAPNSTDQWWQSTRLYLVRPGGSPHSRPLNAIRQQSSARQGVQTIAISTADIAEQAFIAVHLSVGSLRARSAGNTFLARIERVELIA